LALGFLAVWFLGVVGPEVADVPRVVPRVSSGKVMEGVPPGLSLLVEGVFLRLLFLAPVGAPSPLVGV